MLTRYLLYSIGLITIVIFFSACDSFVVEHQVVNYSSLDKSSNPFDVAVLDNLKRVGLPATSVIDDEAFQRRLYIDALGRLPSEDEVVSFQRKTIKRKREYEIDLVLSHSDFPKRWSYIFPEWFRMQRNDNADQFESWAKQQLSGGSDLAKIVSDIIEGKVPSFEQQQPLPGDKVDVIIEAAGGMDAKCVRCHAHFLSRPGDRPFWTAENRYALDAFFATTLEEATPHDAGLGGLRWGLPIGDPQQPAFLFDPSVEVVSTLDTPLDQRREEFAKIFTSSKTFSRGLGHRIFGEVAQPLMNVAHLSYQYEITQMKSPQLMDTIAIVFDEEGKSLRQFLRVLFSAKYYQLSSNEVVELGSTFLSSHTPKRLSPEVIVSAIGSFASLGTRISDVNRAFIYRAFGWPEKRAQVAERLINPNASQGLMLMNSPIVLDIIGSDGGYIDNLSKKISSGETTVSEAITRLFYKTLSRAPSSDLLPSLISLVGKAKGPRKGLEDVAVGILSSVEFMMK